MSEREKKAPNRGKQAGSMGAAMAGAFLLSWLASEFGGVEVPNQVELAVGTLLGWAAGFFTDR